MSTECSRETSLRLTISQAVFFSSVLCSSLLRHFDTAHKGYRCLLYSSSSNMIFQIYWVYYVAFLRREKMTGLTSCWLRANTYLEIQHKGTKKTLSRWFCFTIYSFQFDRVIEVNFYQIQSFITITVLFLSKNLTWMQCVLKQNIAEMSLDMS